MKLLCSFVMSYASQPREIRSLYLAIDDRIVGLFYWDVPGEEPVQRLGLDGERLFYLPDHLLKRFSDSRRHAVYVVVASADSYTSFCNEYSKYSEDETRINRVLIGHIQK